MTQKDEVYPENFEIILRELFCITSKKSLENFFAHMRIFKKQKTK